MWVCLILQLFVGLCTLMFVVAGVLFVAAVDLMLWVEFGAAAAALHLPVIASVILRRAARQTAGAIAL